MSTSNAAISETSLPDGVWEVDPAASAITFKSRGMFGLVPVKGSFGNYHGTLTIKDDEAHGEMKISADSLDTGNAKRDEHLRSADFFDAVNHPKIKFTLTAITVGPDAAVNASGVLQIRATTHTIKAPLTITTVDEGRMRVETSISVDRAAAGVGWSKMGMVQGKAHLHAAVDLVRAHSD